MVLGSVGGRLRGFVGSRSATERVGILAVAAVLVSAPFGGLAKSSDTGVKPVQLHTRYDIGPFYLTFDRVETVSTLAPVVRPYGHNRLLVIEVEVKNHSYRAEQESMVADVIGGDGTGAVPWPREKVPLLQTYNVADGSQETSSQYINPGQSVQLALVVQQAPDWKPGHLVLQLNGYDYQKDDPLDLDPNAWFARHVVARGPIDVEVKP